MKNGFTALQTTSSGGAVSRLQINAVNSSVSVHRQEPNGPWTEIGLVALKGDLNSIIISKTYENVVSDNVGQKVLPDVPSGYRIISAVTEHYRYGCFVSGSHSIRFYVITNTGSPVQATNETIGKLTVTFAKNL